MFLQENITLKLPHIGRFPMAFQRAKETVTQERMRELLSYDQETGIFTWKVDRQGGRGIKPGARAGSVKPTNAGKRYRYIRIDQVDYLAKRLAWFWVKGEWPSFLRCVDGNEDNCSIDNLVDAGYVAGPEGSSRKNRVGQRQRYAAKYPDKVRDQYLRATFDISLEKYNEMHVAQDGKCAICGNPETIERNGKVRLLAVDHCHDSQKVRGLLCGNCNPMIGYAKDNIQVLTKAIEYLRSHTGAI
jgi:hypothetical protein